MTGAAISSARVEAVEEHRLRSDSVGERTA